ncbi:acyl-CoA dehydrogenase family protein [Streptomyces sp. NPDC057702]|uniref:acyl-CoA dehydrogenase family protein n=1 Tax=unclassified Streptomyces TaxID=2593676 RepID=UPI0036805DF3
MENDTPCAELARTAATLRKRLAEDSAEADRERRLSLSTVSALRDAGLFRVMTPKRWGGHAADARTLLAVTSELGRGCASAAWVVGVLNAGNAATGLFPARAQEEVWARRPDAAVALVLAPTATAEPAPGGLRVSGRWAYASGSAHCDAAVVAVPRPGAPDGSDVRLALLPAHEVSVVDTWRVVGMRGTGSGTVRAEDVFVPEHRLLPLATALDGAPSGARGAAGRRGGIAGVLLTSLVGSLLGAARAALEHVREAAPGRGVAASRYGRRGESVPFQLALAEAAGTLDTAHFHADRMARVSDELAERGAPPDLAARARVRADAARAARACREAVETLLDAHGAAAFAEASPLQRIWRDIGVGSRHAAFGVGVPEEMYGRALLGQDPRPVSFLL